MQKIFIVLIASFAATLIIGILTQPLLKRLKLGQVVLGYVEEHKKKNGTPTMGGIMFILGIAITYFLLVGFNSRNSVVAIFIMLGFGIIGFLDDFIKIKFKRNLGLRAYQKIIAQVLIAVIASVYVYYSDNAAQHIPFTKITFDFGVFIIPIIIVVFLSLVNSVNLTDGLDGLSSGVSIIYLVIFSIMLFIESANLSNAGVYSSFEIEALGYLSVIGVGALFAFMLFNSYPAKLFMGDTGSMALGGLTSSIACFSGNSLFIPFVGIMFVVSCVSVVLQVISFKMFKKRIFTMAPFHHHLQQKGLSEPRIMWSYVCVSLIVSSFVLIFSF